MTFSQADTQICLPVPVVDKIILELQELDYLIEKSKIDSQFIHVQSLEISNLEHQTESMEDKIEIQNQLILMESARADQAEKEKRWWKWGGISIVSVAAILILL